MERSAESSDFEVSTTTGMSLCLGCSWSRLRNARPSICGISRSRRYYARRRLIDALESCSAIRRPVDRASLALKQLPDEINDVRIVIDHEDAPIVRRNSGQRAYQCLAIERFHYVIGCAEPKAELLLVDY